MPKQSVTKKVVASKSQRKISTPVGILFALGIGLVLALAGTFGYTKYKERDLQAKAAAWKTITPYSKITDSGDGIKFVGCKTYTTIGPDSQTGKSMKVSIIASKPKDLRFSGSTDKQPRVYVAKFSAAELNDTVTGWGGAVGRTWWANEVSTATINAKDGDEIAVFAESDVSKYAYMGTKEPQAASTKRLYYLPPSRTNYYSDKDFKKAIKVWKNKTVSATQLPNCN